MSSVWMFFATGCDTTRFWLTGFTPSLASVAAMMARSRVVSATEPCFR